MLKAIKYGYCFLLLIFLCGCASITDNHGKKTWTHIELGAGNYGKEGHTKVSQRKTVLKELRYVSKAPNYIDNLPEVDPVAYDPNQQYAVLFSTLDELVKKRGPRGVFHVNDLYAEYANYATQQLKIYARKKGYNQITIEAVSGDYLKIDPKKLLVAYHVTVYDSVHLKNPEVSFFNYGMDGDKMLSDSASRKKARAKLQLLANLSSEGLYFFPIDPADYFIPTSERKNFINKGVFYHATTQWEPVPYYFPEGPIMAKKFGSVYFIKRTKGSNLDTDKSGHRHG